MDDGYQPETVDPRDWSPHGVAVAMPDEEDAREKMRLRYEVDRLKHALHEITRYADGPSYRIACDALREVSR